MKCQNCGKELQANDKFCDGCGAPVQNQQSDNRAETNYQVVQPVQFESDSTLSQVPPNNKKPVYKKWWFWWIIVIVIIAVYAIGMANKDDSNTGTLETTAAETTVEETTEEPTTEEPTTVEPTTEKPTESPAKVEKKFKDSCETIDFKTLSRNPDKYKGNNYKFTGEVIQVQESSWGDAVDLRINVTKETYEYIDDVSWTDTIYATVEIPDEADRILEDDIITFWGTCDGLYSYTSVLGSSVSLPKINIEYYEITTE